MSQVTFREDARHLMLDGVLAIHEAHPEAHFEIDADRQIVKLVWDREE